MNDKPPDTKDKKRSLTSRLKDIIKRRSHHESTAPDRIYDITTDSSNCTAAPQPQHNHPHKRPSSLFIQLGELDDDDDDDDDYYEEEVERRERMEKLLEEDHRMSWPLERLEALKLCLVESGYNGDGDEGKRTSVSEAVARAKEHRRSLHEATPIPNVLHPDPVQSHQSTQSPPPPIQSTQSDSESDTE